jgi:pimeloyl-ACP methyl ester carboxylesterase
MWSASGWRLTRLIDLQHFARLVRGDLELAVKLGRLTARVRIGPHDGAVDITIERGRVTEVGPATGEADLVITAPTSFWQEALVANPAYAAGSLTAGGAELSGDMERIVAPHYAAWERLLTLLRLEASGPGTQHRPAPVRWETDDAVGRYAHVRNGDREARIYYEVAGQGSVPLLLHTTAGADSRQWRHLLAYPELRRRFRMIAYDLPAHGKSLPVLGERWWEHDYLPDRDELLGWAVGMVDALSLDRPIFMGCSVGGQLALDLAAYRRDQFRAFVSLNGWCRPSPGMAAFDNTPFRDPAISAELYAGRVLATTSPVAPEASRHETYWIYRSNAPGVYAGDNDYFMTAHDLTIDGWRIDTTRTPLFALAGEFDRSSLSPEDGAPAIPRHVKGAVYRMLPGLGHFAPSDDPELFCATITPILDEVLAACDEVKEY